MTKGKDLCSGAATNRTALNLSRQHECIKMKRMVELRALNDRLNKSYLGKIEESCKKKKKAVDIILEEICMCSPLSAKPKHSF